MSTQQQTPIVKVGERFTINVLGSREWDGYVPRKYHGRGPMQVVAMNEDDVLKFIVDARYTKEVRPSCFIACESYIQKGIQEIEVTSSPTSDGSAIYYSMRISPFINDSSKRMGSVTVAIVIE